MEPRRAAIIVGVNRYDQDSGIRPLEFAVDDCTQLHGFLQYRAGYEPTRLLLEPSKAQVLEAFEQVTATLGPGDLLLFFFAGHGVEFNGKHLLLCRPARLSRLRHFDEVIPVEQVRDETAKPGLHRLIILDSCRSDLLRTRSAAGGTGLKGEQHLRDIAARLSEEREVDAGSVAVLCSCPENAQALELPSVRQGLFTAAFLEEMDEAVKGGGELKLSDVFVESLGRRMARLAREHGQVNWKQRPWVQWSGAMPAMIGGTAAPERPKPAARTLVEPEPPAPSVPTAVAAPPPVSVESTALAVRVPPVVPPRRRKPPALPPKPRTEPDEAEVNQTRAKIASDIKVVEQLRAEIAQDVNAVERLVKTGKGVGDHLKKSWMTRKAYWSRAAKLGWPEGLWLMGTCLKEGIGEPANQAQAATLYAKAAAKGLALAQASLAECHDQGLGVKPDQAQAVTWYRKAADQGHAAAQFNLAFCYGTGRGVAANKTQAAQWYRKAAEQGHAAAQLKLGLYYDAGTGVAQDKTEAVRWFRKAADQGDVSAQYIMGVCCDNGQGVAQDKPQAVAWYRKAADQGLASALYNLAVCYDNGEGVAQNLAEAAKLYRRAADQGYPSAQHNLAICYAKGRGVAADQAEANRWYRKAAEQGHADAQFNLAVRLGSGAGVAQDKTQAVQWYRKAADQGSAAAQNNLAVRYERGEGVAKDLNEAVKWYRKAADQGFAAAQYNMGVCCENGQGVPRNKDEALKWYRKAAEQGDASAQKALKRKCYLSTAAAGVMGWADDGVELNLLRHMRDTYMMETPARRAEVAAYYRTAPRIVPAIDAGANPAGEWRRIAQTHLVPAVALIRSGRLPAAHRHYRTMVSDLSARWLERPT